MITLCAQDTHNNVIINLFGCFDLKNGFVFAAEWHSQCERIIDILLKLERLLCMNLWLLYNYAPLESLQ